MDEEIKYICLRNIIISRKLINVGDICSKATRCLWYYTDSLLVTVPRQQITLFLKVENLGETLVWYNLEWTALGGIVGIYTCSNLLTRGFQITRKLFRPRVHQNGRIVSPG